MPNITDIKKQEAGDSKGYPYYPHDYHLALIPTICGFNLYINLLISRSYDACTRQPQSIKGEPMMLSI